VCRFVRELMVVRVVCGGGDDVEVCFGEVVFDGVMLYWVVVGY